MAQEGAAVVATDLGTEKKSNSLAGQAILAAALAIPMLNQTVQAETAPESTFVSFKYLDYKDSQPDQDRIKVKAQAVSVLMPFAGDWSVQATATKDTVSGASPRFWTKSTASMRDKRNASDIAVTRYFSHDTLTLSASLSDENDYRSESFAFNGTHATEDKNTTFNYGYAVSNDDIHVAAQDLNKSKRRVDFALGVTQVLTQKDIVQVTLTSVNGQGYFSDPYKFSDIRPGSRHQQTGQIRWNHFISGPDATLKLSYRYYTDSWSVKAHTFGVEYVQPLANNWTITPSLRIHDQSAADFYINPAD